MRILCEGATEDEFVRAVLRPHLLSYDVYAEATIVGKTVAHRRGHRERGGGSFVQWKRDFDHHTRGDLGADIRFTCLFDLYGLPNDFPGMAKHGRDPDTNRRCDALEQCLAEAVGDHRFRPYIQRHEFEALVLASLATLRETLDTPAQLQGVDVLEAEIAGLAPEDVNDGVDSAPSKRLLKHIPAYRKSLHGPLAVEGTGLPVLRERCPRFDAWVTYLETP